MSNVQCLVGNEMILDFRYKTLDISRTITTVQSLVRLSKVSLSKQTLDIGPWALDMIFVNATRLGFFP